MPTTGTTPLMPSLPDFAVKRLSYPTTDLRDGDQLHTLAPVADFPKGSVLPVYGFCVCYTPDGQPYSSVAYVRGNGKPYSQRDAKLFPAENQREQWFGPILLFLVEIDLTDHAHCLTLERQPQEQAPEGFATRLAA